MVHGAGKAVGRAAALALGRLLLPSVVRRLDGPRGLDATMYAGVRTVTVGGATFGGSGKTPLAIACALELASTGAQVVFVGHGYRARPGAPRVVTSDDALDDVGDEALLAARALAPAGVRVVVAPTRRTAIALAARLANVLVIDGVAQLTPVRASLALLALDSRPARRSFGARGAWSGSLGSFGSMRAPMAVLLDACDGVVPMVEAATEPGRQLDDRTFTSSGAVPWPPPGTVRPRYPARIASRGVWGHGGALLTWAWLRRSGLRVGLLSALARPGRIEGALARHGVHLAAVVSGRDHGPFDGRHARAVAAARVDLWLATPKCALHVRAAGARTGETGRAVARRLPELDVAVIDHALDLDPGLRTLLHNLVS